MDMLALGAVGVVAALFAVMVRQRAPEMALVLAMAACVLLLWNTLPLLESIRDVMEELASLTEISPTLLRPMLQTVGLALVTKLAAALCRDAGGGEPGRLRGGGRGGGRRAGGLAPVKNGPPAGHGAAVRRGLLLVPLLMLLLMPTALALDQGEIWEKQTQALGLDELEQAGEAYTGQTEIGEDLDVAQSFHHMAQTGKEALGGVVKASVRSCVLLLAVTLLCGLAEGLQVGGTDRLGAVTLVGALVITTIAVGDVNSLLAQGKQAISNMEALGGRAPAHRLHGHRRQRRAGHGGGEAQHHHPVFRPAPPPDPEPAHPPVLCLCGRQRGLGRPGQRRAQTDRRAAEVAHHHPSCRWCCWPSSPT